MYLSRLAIVSLAVALACGGGSDTTSPTSGGGASNPPPPGSVTVTIRNYSFSPAAITIKAGTTVHWTNAGPSTHTTVSDSGVWTSGNLAAPGGSNDPYGGGSTTAGTFNFTFNTAGTYPYHCNLHPPSAFPGFTG